MFAQLQVYKLRYFLEITYNGTPYHGWQRQPNALTVQEEIEHALSTLLRKELTIMGAGRTDAGVHAKQLYAHFDFDKSWNVQDLKQLQYRLNQFLSKHIAILSINRVNDDAHARFDAISRSYEYHIVLQKNPFKIDNAWFLQQEIDVAAMNEAVQELIGQKDFKCFSRSNTDVKTYICDVTDANWKKEHNQLIFFISADRFLRNMVRAVVGTLLEIGLGKQNKNYLIDVLKSQDRSKAGPSAPAHGLYLTQVSYPKEIFKNYGNN